ncbi:unnamed protein product [Caenorhabditis auriculariae]|uniref:Uncharacterized protein n=1 Tax=Caenorhabditis auriculariae TaxID=2777116 RepID=A0A8S1HVV4_9PELO|nr:unnamed protein product [Caenorhabditis auriculariae]
MRPEDQVLLQEANMSNAAFSHPRRDISRQWAAVCRRRSDEKKRASAHVSASILSPRAPSAPLLLAAFPWVTSSSFFGNSSPSPSSARCLPRSSRS